MINRIFTILIIVFGSFVMGHAQCFGDRHTTNAFDGWISCDKSMNPNSIHGQSHWIRYDFGATYSLYDMVLWNVNHPEYLDDGIKDLIVEYSTDNSNWILFDTITVPRASASGFYQGIIGPDLDGTNARYLLLTAVDNHGGGCYGLSEMKVFTTNQSEVDFNLAFSPCEGDGIMRNISSGLELDGTYSGIGVTDNSDETFNFDAGLAGPGIHEISYSYPGGSKKTKITVYPCDNPICANCPNCGEFDATLVNANPIPTNVYHDGALTASGIVAANQPVNFRGSQEVNMNAGFEVKPNSDFLAEIRECDESLMINPGFEENGNEWDLYVNTSAGTAAAVSYVTTNPYAETTCARINVTNATGTNWHVQLIQDGFTIVEGKNYEISFYARSDGNATFTFIAQMDYDPYTWEVGEQITLTNNWQKYTLNFTASQSLDGNVNGGMRMAPNTGEFPGTFYFDQFKFLEK